MGNVSLTFLFLPSHHVELNSFVIKVRNRSEKREGHVRENHLSLTRPKALYIRV